MAVRDWITGFLNSHRSRFHPGDWPRDESSDDALEFIRGWVTAFNLKGVTEAEADAASRTLVLDPPNFRREHIPRVIAAVEAARRERNAGNPAPGSTMFNFGRGVGVIMGAAMALGFRVETVTPQKWQKHFQLGLARDCASKSEWKNKLKAKAQQLFPHVEVTLKTADALLLWEYGQRMEAGK